MRTPTAVRPLLHRCVRSPTPEHYLVAHISHCTSEKSQEGYNSVNKLLKSFSTWVTLIICMEFEHRGEDGLWRQFAPESAMPSCRYYAANTLKVPQKSYARLLFGRRRQEPIPVLPSCPRQMCATPTTVFISQKRLITGKGYVKTNCNPSKSEDSQVCMYWTAYGTDDLVTLPR